MESSIDVAQPDAPNTGAESGPVIVSSEEFDRLLLLNGVGFLRQELRLGAFDERTSKYAEDLIKAVEAEVEEAHKLAVLRSMRRTETATWIAAILTFFALV